MNFAQNYIEFLLGNRLERISWEKQQMLSPTTTVLQYLRGMDHYKGTKEGCAEGDCGACTVVIASVSSNGKLTYKAINSCLIFLPQLHGKQLITVEHLAQPKELHPVQKAMIELDASQCGFCTPGFVMSMFALYHTIQNPTDEDILEAFSGNLCRCTGYRSIIGAARKALSTHTTDRFQELEQETIQTLQSIECSDSRFTNLHQTYYLPSNLASALNLKFTFPDIEINAGSSDIALRVTKKKEVLTSLLDLSGVKELKYITKTSQGFDIGSGTDLQSIKEELGEELPPLKKILSVFGSKQIRQVATLGGNLGSASPIGDLIPLLMAYQAKLVLKSLIQERTIAVTDFIKGYRQTALIPGEIITNIHIPNPDTTLIIDVEKISKRTDLDISTVSIAMRLQLKTDRTIESIFLYYGGMAATVAFAKNTCTFLEGKKWEPETLKSAFEYLEKDVNPISDARAQAEGRMALAKNLLLKLWQNNPK
ncbi:MAG: xanthine dehydrogenase small subunit [Salinivirgaceae bacterium]|nr:xanthine dehydrogenase small subunit [Salinivirgaceae bacterium]